MIYQEPRFSDIEIKAVCVVLVRLCNGLCLLGPFEMLCKIILKLKTKT